MLVPLSWLRDYVALPADPAYLVERLTLAGLEAAGVKVFGLPVPPGLRVKPEDAGLVWERDKVLVGRVLKIEKHPDADKLKLVTLDYGAAEPKTVVTGAPNIAPGQSGMKVILGLRGTRYFYADKDGKKAVFTLEPKALRGIMNDAMCMSNYELGTSDEHEGIIILDEADPAPGTPAADALGDVVVELDVLPNMARCLSIIGIAREVAALTGGKTTIAEPTVQSVAEKIDGKVSVEIADPKLCGRYTATVIRNVTIGPAPRWMRSRLELAGMRPISNAVDITNYVMLEYGQPLHAFDYDVLVTRAGGKAPLITVRPAKAGEKLKTLDGQDRELGPENLVIADAAGPIAIAGVMGGLDTEVTAATKTILLESAAFDFVSVRKTARQFTLFSEASTRFSRGVHPELAKPAAVRATELFRTLAGGEVLAGVVDAYPAPIPPQVIELTPAAIRRVLGFDIPPAEVERVLTALQFKVETHGDGWRVTTPPTRLDIQAGAADLIEELARVYGYDHLPDTRLSQPLPEQLGNRPLELEEHVRDLLADQGLQECITYSLTGAASEARLHPAGKPRAVTSRSSTPSALTAGDASDAAAGPARGRAEEPPHARRRDAVRDRPGLSANRRPAPDRAAAAGARPVRPPVGRRVGRPARRQAVAVRLLRPQGNGRGAGRGPPPAGRYVPGGEDGAAPPPGPVGGAGRERGVGRRVRRAAPDGRGELRARRAGGAGGRNRPGGVAVGRARALSVPAVRDGAAGQAGHRRDRPRGHSRGRGAGGNPRRRRRTPHRGRVVRRLRRRPHPGRHPEPGVRTGLPAADKTLTDKEIDKAHQKIEGRLRHVLKAQIRGKDV